MEAGMDDDLWTSDIDPSGDLVTVATFDDSVSASIALNRLKEAGLPAVLSDENAVTMDWLLSIAIGGIKVQVNPKDAETARCLLEHHEQLTAADAAAVEAESAAKAEEIIGNEAAELITASPEAECEAARTSETDQKPLEDEPPPTERERNADRALRGAVLGVAFPPLQLYVLYLLFRVFVSEEDLDDRHRHKAIAAGVINLVVLVGSYFLIKSL
jgi:hypothetical protein